MNNKELERILQYFDTRITTVNERTKSHTIQIRELQKKVKELEKKNGKK